MADLHSSVVLERRGDVAVLTLRRVAKRNALDDKTVAALGRAFADPPDWAKVVVLAAAGEHFSAGLDLNELIDMDAVAGLHHSRRWHEVFTRIESGPLPVVAVLKGAVIGAGLELAACAHVRVAEDSTYFALPEGQRGIFVGGGASVRVPRLIGVHRMMDMMLTGRVLGADEGAQIGLAHYRVADGAGLTKALDLATAISQNSTLANFAIIQALPRIAEAPGETGLLLESLMAALTQISPQAQERMTAFLSGQAAKVTNMQEDR